MKANEHHHPQEELEMIKRVWRISFVHMKINHARPRTYPAVCLYIDIAYPFIGFTSLERCILAQTQKQHILDQPMQT